MPFFIRVSSLESFRRVVQGLAGTDERELIAYIENGQDGEPTWKMLAGTAWHEMLSMPHVPVGTSQVKDSTGRFWFLTKDVEYGRKLIGAGVQEITGYKDFQTRWGEKVLLKGTADHIRGLRISDNKTKFSTPDGRDYENSLQWRFYLWLHDCWEFRYYLWPFSNPDRDTSGLCELRSDAVWFSFYAYPGMIEECGEWVNHFFDWSDRQNLLHHLWRD